MVTGYLLDMSALFSALAARVKPGGRVVFAVGNSAHGPSDTGVVVASDVLLTAAAAAAGFEPDRIAGRILGMGDIVSLVEKAQETIEAAQAERMMRRFQKGMFNMNDLKMQVRF